MLSDILNINTSYYTLQALPDDSVHHYQIKYPQLQRISTINKGKNANISLLTKLYCIV